MQYQILYEAVDLELKLQTFVSQRKYSPPLEMSWRFSTPLKTVNQ